MLNNEKWQVVITQRILRYSKNIFRSVLAMFLVMALLLTMPYFPFNYGIAEASSTQHLWNLEIGDRVVDNSWQWEYRTGVNYTGYGVTKPVVWIVVAKNHYGAGSGVTLLSEELIGAYCFDNSTNRGSEFGSNHWGSSGTPNASHGLRPWLNSTGIHSKEGFYDAFSSSFKSSIVTVSLPNKEWRYGNTYTTNDKVFIPSNTELGDTEHFWTYQIGSTYDYFSGVSSSDRKARLGTTFWNYWTRSPYSDHLAPYPIENPIDTPYMVCYVEDSGKFGGVYASHPSEGVRPALNLRFDTQVSRTTNSAGFYEINPSESSYYVDIDPVVDFYKIFVEEYHQVITDAETAIYLSTDLEFMMGISNLVNAGLLSPYFAALLVGAGSGFMIAKVIDILLEIYYDPPDEQYYEVVELEAVEEIQQSGDSLLAESMALFANNLLNMNAILDAILITMERLQGAEQANEQIFIAIQAKALRYYSELLIKNQQDLKDSLGLYGNEIIVSFELNSDEIMDELNRLSTLGLNTQERELLILSGFTSDEIQHFEDQLQLLQIDEEQSYLMKEAFLLWANWIDETALPDLEQGVLVINELLDSILLAKTNDIENLILEIDDTIDSRNINRGQGNALKSILSAAMQNLDLGNTNAAIKQLQAFINLVNAYVRTERLEAEVGNYWIDRANQAKEIFILLIE